MKDSNVPHISGINLHLIFFDLTTAKLLQFMHSSPCQQILFAAQISKAFICLTQLVQNN